MNMKKKMVACAACAALCMAVMAQGKERVLVVCAHPDDSIAMAGTMFLMKDKFEIHVADLTKGQFRDIKDLGRDGPMAARRMAERNPRPKGSKRNSPSSR